MPETTEAEQLEQPVETPQEQPQESPEQQEASQQTPAEKQKKPNNMLIPLLTVLLVLLGIGEAVFWGCFALSVYSNSLARERYEQQQKALAEEQASKGIKGGSSYSPNLKVENGVVTWERDKWAYTGSSGPANTSADILRREDGLRLARLPVVEIPYALAETDTEARLPSEASLSAEPSSAEPETGGAVPLNA